MVDMYWTDNRAFGTSVGSALERASLLETRTRYWMTGGKMMERYSYLLYWYFQGNPHFELSGQGYLLLLKTWHMCIASLRLPQWSIMSSPPPPRSLLLIVSDWTLRDPYVFTTETNNIQPASSGQLKRGRARELYRSGCVGEALAAAVPARMSVFACSLEKYIGLRSWGEIWIGGLGELLIISGWQLKTTSLGRACHGRLGRGRSRIDTQADESICCRAW